MDDCCAYQTEPSKSNTKKFIIAGGVGAAIAAIFAFSNVSGAPPEKSASMEQAGAFAQPLGTTATTANSTPAVEAPATTANFTPAVEAPVTTANSTQPVAVPATAANSTLPVEMPASGANSTLPFEAAATTANSTQSVEAPTTSATSTRPVEAPTATQPVQSSKRASMSKKDITRMQARLRSLGYLSVSPTGTFGPKTEAALRAFKTANGLPEDEVWDEETKIRLSSKKAIRTPAHVANAVKRP